MLKSPRKAKNALYWWVGSCEAGRPLGILQEFIYLWMADVYLKKSKSLIHIVEKFKKRPFLALLDSTNKDSDFVQCSEL